MKQHIIFCITFFSFSFLHGNFLQRSQAANAAQKKDWKAAEDQFVQLMINNPDDPVLLYDAGVVSFEQKKFENAHAYFKNASTSKNANALVKEQACFNLGNTCVELKKLEDAITHYEEVLVLNADNEKAKHNLEIVKKMLEEQKQQEQQQQQNQDQKNDQQKQDQEQDQQQKKEQQENQNDDSSKNQNSNQQQNDNSKSERSSDNDEKQEEGQRSGSDESSEQSDKDSKREQEEDTSSESQREQDKQENNNQNGHEESPEQQADQQSDNQNKNQEQKEQENASSENIDTKKAKYDRQVMQLLAAIEKRDAEANKKMMAAQMKQVAGDYDKNQKNY